MFKNLRGISVALQALVDVLAALLRHHEEAGDVLARVEELERSRALWEARMEAELVKLGAKEKAIRASEQRAHAKLQRIEELESANAGAGAEDGADLSEEEWERLQMAELRAGNGAAGDEQGMLPLHDGVGRRAERARAAQLKWHR